jgi:hypothetical protein
LCGLERLLAEVDLGLAGSGGVGEKDAEVDGPGVVIPVEDCDLDFAAAGEKDGRSETLVSFHDKGNEVIGPDVEVNGGSVSLVGVGGGSLSGGLEVEVGSVKTDDEGLGGARSEERGGLGEGWTDLLFLWDRPEDDAFVAGKSGAGGGLGAGGAIGVAGLGMTVDAGLCGLGLDQVAMGNSEEESDGSDDDRGGRRDGQAAERDGVGLAVGGARRRGDGKLPGEKEGAEGEQAAGVEDPAVGELVSGSVKAEGEDVAVELAGMGLEGDGKELARVGRRILGLGGRRGDFAQAVGEQGGGQDGDAGKDG